MKQFLLAIFLGIAAPVAFSQNLYDLDRILEIQIFFQEKNWSVLLDSMKAEGKGSRLPATVTIDGKKLEKVGVRYKGNSSYKNPRSKGQKKLPFNLKANFEKKDQTFPGGYETLKLSNVFQDPSFLREVLSYEIARKYMPASRCNFVKVFVNGEYLGLYNNAQSVDNTFLEEHYGTSGGTLIKCDPEWEDVKDLEDGCPEGDKASLMYRGEAEHCYKGWYELQGNKKSGWQELIDLTKLLTQQPERIHEAINVDAVLWMHAFNNVLVNLDSYTGRLSHNYYLYRTPDSLFTPIVWDMNISFGGFRYDGEKQGVLDNEELQTYSLFAHYKSKNPKRPLITNVLANPLYRKIYTGHCRTILMENFANGQYLTLAEKVRQLIDQEVKNDPNKLYSYHDFQKNLTRSVDIGYSSVIGIEELMKRRTEYLLAHPLMNGRNPEVSAVKHTANAVTATVKSAIKVFLVSRGGITEPFRMTEMFDDGTHTDGAPNDGVWGVSVKMKPGTHYYIIAEGDRLAICSPERAAFEYYEVK